MERHNSPLKIAVGTTSSWKIAYLDEVLNEMEIDSEIISVEAKSGVPDQPIEEKLVKKGSKNRAKVALRKVEDCDFALGIEVGYQKNSYGNYEMFCYSTALDNSEREVARPSSKLVLPQFFQDLLKQGKYLGDHVEEYEQKDHHPSSLYLARVIRYRKPFIAEAIRNCLLIFLHEEEF